MKTQYIPVEINLNRATRILQISFEDGSHFSLPSEYLRVFSPAAEAKVARASGDWIVGKQQVNIERIAPVGNYAVQIVFDDGQDTGVYSWETLYELGRDREQNWRRYLQSIQKAETSWLAVGDSIELEILYFATLVSKLELESERVRIPLEVDTVSGLLRWLRKRGGPWSENLTQGRVTVTVNKQFSQPGTRIKSTDEISITPNFP